MDIEKLIEQLRKNNIENNCHDCALGYYAFEAATALSTLQAENENLRAELEEAIKLIKEREVFHKKILETADKAIAQSIEFLDDMKRMKQDLDEAVAELEQVKNERDSARVTLHYLQLYGLKEI